MIMKQSHYDSNLGWCGQSWVIQMVYVYFYLCEKCTVNGNRGSFSGVDLVTWMEMGQTSTVD